MIDELPELHLELTTKCTLTCPACPRTYSKGEFAVTDLPTKAIERLVKKGGHYRNIILCGDYGDPIYHPDFHKIIELFQTLPGSPPIIVATNGSYKSETWWSTTAKLMRPFDEFIFGIDGLEDTSHIYRRNNNWASILKGIQILKSQSQCRVLWQWILFKYNQNQIASAATLAKKLKIDSFLIIQSFRHQVTKQWSPTISVEEALKIFRQSYDLS